MVMSKKEKHPGLTDNYWVTQHNFLEEVRNQFTLPEQVHIHDVTLREAEQAPHVVLRPEEKLRIYEALDEMGVYSVEIFPLVSDDDKEVAKELVKMRRKTKTKVFFLCRWHKEEVDFALETGADGVIVEGTSDPWFANVALNGITADQMYKMYVETTAHAKKNGIFTTVMPWDTARAPLPFIERLFKGIVNEGGADHVVIADTHGSSLPWAIANFVRKMKEWVPGVPIEMHCHNDHGLATSIMLSAVAAGASVVHTSINCLGERSGNAATEEVALNLELLLGVKTGVRLDKLYPFAQMVADMTKIPIARNKPVIGDNEFTYESGMVVYVVERMAASGERPFQTYLPEVIGRKGWDVVVGKGTGAGVVAKKIAKFGLKATKDQVAEITRRVKNEASLRKWSISDDVLEIIAKDVLEGR
jgi:isopropylmalate/homocitrate/citramalate synthase